MIHPDPSVRSTEEKADKLTPEQAAILASATKVETDLSGQVQHDAQGNLIDPAQEQDQGDPIAENAALLSMLVAVATPAFPFIGQCYTPDVVNNIATAYTAVEIKYGWEARKFVGPELGLALVAIPPTIAAVMLGRQHFAELRAKREAEQARKTPETALDAATKGAIGG